MTPLIIAQLILAPGPLPSGLHTRVHLEAVVSPLVQVGSSADDGSYPESDSSHRAWGVGGRGLFGIAYTPRWEVAFGAGYTRYRWSRTSSSVPLEVRLISESTEATRVFRTALSLVLGSRFDL